MASPSRPAALPVTPERIAKLRAFGLSEYAARAYLALLQLGTTEARDVSSLSKVPASKIYHILDQLGEKGLVTVLPEFPRKYAPVPFADFLQRLHDEHVAAAREIREERPLLLETFAVEPEPSSSDRGSVTLLRGRRNVRDRGVEALADAEHEVLALLTPGQMRAGEGAWSAPLDAARARGIDVRILVAGDGSKAHPSPLPSDAFAIVIDQRLALLAHVLPDDGHPTEGNDTALVVEQEGLVALFSALLGSRWDAVSHTIPVDAGGERSRDAVAP